MAEQTEKDIIFDAVKEVLAQMEAEKSGKTAETPQKLAININGARYEFDTQEQLDQAVSTLATTARTQIEEARKAAEAAKPGAYVTGKENEPQFDQDQYVDLMHKDIPKAQSYALDHVFGIPNAVETIKQSLAESQALKSTVAVYQFKEQHPEVNVKDKAVTDVLEGIRRELGQPFTPQGLEAAYGVAQARGLMPSPQLIAYKQQQEEAAKNQGGDPVSNFTTGVPQRTSALGFQPPPTPGRSVPAAAQNFEQQLDNMSTAELEALFTRMGISHQ